MQRPAAGRLNSGASAENVMSKDETGIKSSGFRDWSSLPKFTVECGDDRNRVITIDSLLMRLRGSRKGLAGVLLARL
jgi:hypothetical protein